MSITRNPFFLRASERTEPELFLRLFSPEVLDLLPDNPRLWSHPVILRSAPGGGKTSLLRLFTPQALGTVFRLKSQDEYRDIYRRLRDLGALTDAGPQVLGISHSCARNYALLEDLDLELGRRTRLFLALLNSRILVSSLRAAADRMGIQFPHALDALTLQISNTAEPAQSLPSDFPRDARGLYDWACTIERDIYSALDSFGSLSQTRLPGHDSLLSLSFLSSTEFLYDGYCINPRTVVMLDDVQELSQRQRRVLLEMLLQSRLSLGVWLAERLEVLQNDELLAKGALTQRDYEDVVCLEDHWRARGGSTQFERFARNIADRRVREDTSVSGIGSFSTCLLENLDGVNWSSRFLEAAETEAAFVRSKFGKISAYGNWIAACEAAEGTSQEQALAWRRTRILIEREERRQQPTLGFTLPSDLLEDNDTSDVKGAAELFLSVEHKIPYYFGLDRIAAVASGNVEQFLRISSRLFEEVSAAAVLKMPHALPPERQHKILKDAVREEWDKLPNRVPNGFRVKRFLESVGNFCHWATFQPNAPYAPGVTGIAILMSDRERLRDPKFLANSIEHAHLSEVLSTCIAYNLIESKLDHSCKGRSWMLLHLNRMFCVLFDLPLTRGGWKERPLSELSKWLDQGYQPPRAKEISA